MLSIAKPGIPLIIRQPSTRLVVDRNLTDQRRTSGCHPCLPVTIRLPRSTTLRISNVKPPFNKYSGSSDRLSTRWYYSYREVCQFLRPTRSSAILSISNPRDGSKVYLLVVPAIVLVNPNYENGMIKSSDTYSSSRSSCMGGKTLQTRPVAGALPVFSAPETVRVPQTPWALTTAWAPTTLWTLTTTWALTIPWAPTTAWG
jgi:hypothetical protein